jgi:hypothetical protein
VAALEKMLPGRRQVSWILRPTIVFCIPRIMAMLVAVGSLEVQTAAAAPIAPAPGLSAPAQVADVQSNAHAPAIPSLEHRAGYPTTREMWRYCPRDGSHPCVDLDIPGVTTPDTSSVTTPAEKTAH